MAALCRIGITMGKVLAQTWFNIVCLERVGKNGFVRYFGLNSNIKLVSDNCYITPLRPLEELD